MIFTLTKARLMPISKAVHMIKALVVSREQKVAQEPVVLMVLLEGTEQRLLQTPPKWRSAKAHFLYLHGEEEKHDTKDQEAQVVTQLQIEMEFLVL